MYAIIQVGSSQYKVSEGDTINANRLKEEVGKNITVDKVLLFSKGSDVRIGQPYLKDVKVTAKVIDHNQFRYQSMRKCKFLGDALLLCQR